MKSATANSIKNDMTLNRMSFDLDRMGFDTKRKRDVRVSVLDLIYDNERLWSSMWRYTDAYGTPGHMPSQGYDWSGFRDSSWTAIEKMVVAMDRQLHFDAISFKWQQTIIEAAKVAGMLATYHRQTHSVCLMPGTDHRPYLVVRGCGQLGARFSAWVWSTWGEGE